MIVFALAGWSGFFVMAVELLSGRVLAPSFGNSIYVWGAVITVFMLALAVGYLAGGQLSLFAPSLRRLGALLIAAGLATLPVVFFGNAALDWIFDRVADPRYGVAARVRRCCSSSRRRFRGRSRRTRSACSCPTSMSSGKSAGSLYFVSTFGSAAGTILTSFYLVLLFEVNHDPARLDDGVRRARASRGPVAGAGAMKRAVALPSLSRRARALLSLAGAAGAAPPSCTPSARSTATSSSSRTTASAA